MMVHAMRSLAAVAFLAVLGPASAQADPVLEFSSGDLTYTNTYLTLGWSFTTNSAITVTALDAYLDGVTSTNVRLYDASGDVLATTTVSTSDTLEGSPISFYSHTLANSVALAANTTYFIAEDVFPNSSHMYYLVSGLTTDPSITYGGAVSTTGTGGLPISDGLSNNSLDPSVFGPNFDIAPAAPATVPEPSSILLCGSAMLSLAGYRLRRLSRLPASSRLGKA